MGFGEFVVTGAAERDDGALWGAAFVPAGSVGWLSWPLSWCRWWRQRRRRFKIIRPKRTEPEHDEDGNYVSPWVRVLAAAETLVGVLRHARVSEQILGPSGPALAAEGLHPWVWHAAVNLWDGGHYKQAVNAAAAVVEKQTQVRLNREDISGTKLYTEAFALDAKTGDRRLRFGHLTEMTASGNRTEAWKSAHEGAMNFGRGCAQGIRNMNAHGTGDLPEQEALEYLAALSVLARWVETAEVSDPEPF